MIADFAPDTIVLSATGEEDDIEVQNRVPIQSCVDGRILLLRWLHFSDPVYGGELRHPTVLALVEHIMDGIRKSAMQDSIEYDLHHRLLPICALVAGFQEHDSGQLLALRVGHGDCGILCSPRRSFYLIGNRLIQNQGRCNDCNFRTF